MVTDEKVLLFFREELPVLGWLPVKDNAPGMNDILQEYTEPEDLMPAIIKYGQVFDVDITSIKMERYYPWKISWFFRKWFTKNPVKQISQPLTIKMFAESAKAGRWLYD